MKHNNQIPNGHFRKQWQRRVKTWFDQAGAKKSRRVARAAKAAAVAPRPVDSLRPAVRCPTIKYNVKLRAGRGFSLVELKAAGISRKQAMTIGIAVDHRRRNKSEEGVELNKQRLLAYKSRLIVFPKKATAAEISAAKQQSTAACFPLPAAEEAVVKGSLSGVDTSSSVYTSLRKAWGVARHHGIRAKRAAEKKAEAESKAK